MQPQRRFTARARAAAGIRHKEKILAYSSTTGEFLRAAVYMRAECIREVIPPTPSGRLESLDLGSRCRAREIQMQRIIHEEQRDKDLFMVHRSWFAALGEL